MTKVFVNMEQFLNLLMDRIASTIENYEFLNQYEKEQLCIEMDRNIDKIGFNVKEIDFNAFDIDVREEKKNFVQALAFVNVKE